MKRRYAVVAVSVVLAVVLAVAALAQQQGGSSQFSAMREKYKYTFQLMTMVRHIEEVNKDKKYTLTSTQAKKMLAIFTPWRSKPKMTQDQAKGVARKLKTVLTVNQLNAMARIKPHVGRGPDRGRGPGGGPPRDPQAGGRHFDPNAMKDFNPFYSKVPKGDTRAAERAKRWNEFFAALQKKAKGK